MDNLLRFNKKINVIGLQLNVSFIKFALYAITYSMRFYREKILLALLERLPEPISDLQLQKLMFLLCDSQSVRSYEFMPYRYGCFSMQLSSDLKRLCNDGYVSIGFTAENNKQITISRQDFGMNNLIKDDDRDVVAKIVRRFAGMTASELIRYTYTNYPFFAVNSIIAKNYLTDEQLDVVNKFKVEKTAKTLYTIGYEGIPFERYFVYLLKNGIKVLCDVRKNAYSQKFGFSKATLKKACEGTGILYVHLPQLGIESEKRQSLETQSDYDLLFDEYAKTVLARERDALNYIYILLQQYGQVALTCFEHDPLQCHRRKVAEKLMSTSKCNYNLIHI